MPLNPFSLHKPETTLEAAGLFSRLPDVRILAGGTFLINHLRFLKKRELKTPAHVISLRHVKELKGISQEREGGLRINAMTTFRELLASPLVRAERPALISICQQIGTTPIRNMGTIGGNVTCRYAWAELGAVLIALNAKLHFLNAQGEETILSSEDFFHAGAKTDKILTAVSLPPAQNSQLIYRRVPKTPAVDIPLLAVCLNVRQDGQTLTDIRIAINTGTTLARRDKQLEELMENHFKTSPVERQRTGAEMASQRFQVPHDVLNYLTTVIYDHTGDEYKNHLFRVTLTEALGAIRKN